MNKFYLIIALILLLPLGVQSQTKSQKQEQKEAFERRDKYLFAAKPVQKNFTHTLPYKATQTGHIIVPVVIAGTTYRFLFDTGASTVVSAELKDKLGFKSIFSNKLADGSGQVEEQQFYQIGQLQLGPVAFKDVVGPALDMSKFDKLFCVKLDGIFGTNIMRRCYWKIDYEAKTITFSDKKIKLQGKVNEIDFTEDFSGSPLLRQVIGKYNFMATMDTGYNGSFSVRDSLYFNSGKSKGAKLLVGRGKSTTTLFESKNNYEYAVIVDTMYIGEYLLKNQFVNVAAGNSYLIGNEFFEKFGSVLLDWKKSKIYIPQVTVKEDTYFKSFGLNPIYVGDDLQVGMIWESSAVAKACIDIGDTIVSINGIPVKNMPRDKWCEIVEAIGNDNADVPVQMLFRKKDGSEKELTLRKADLFAK